MTDQSPAPKAWPSWDRATQQAQRDRDKQGYRGRTPRNTSQQARYRARLETAISAALSADVLRDIRRTVARAYGQALKASLASGETVSMDLLRGDDDALMQELRQVTAGHVEATNDPVKALRVAHAIGAASRLALWDAVELVKAKLGERFDDTLHTPPYWMGQAIGEGASAFALRRSLALAGHMLRPGLDSRKAWQVFTASMDRSAYLRTRFIHTACDEDIKACLDKLRLPEVWKKPAHVGHVGGATRRAVGMLARSNPGDERAQVLARMVRNRSIVNGRDLRRVAWKLGIERELRWVLDAQ